MHGLTTFNKLKWNLFSKNCFFYNQFRKRTRNQKKISFFRVGWSTNAQMFWFILSSGTRVTYWKVFLFFRRRIIEIFVHFYRSFFRLIAFFLPTWLDFYSNNYIWFGNIALTDDEFQGFQWLLKSREIRSGDLDIIFFSFLIKYRDRLLLSRINSSCIAWC